MERLAGTGPVRLAITPGDGNGIGPEVTLKALDVLDLLSPEAGDEIHVRLIGPADIWATHAAVLGFGTDGWRPLHDAAPDLGASDSADRRLEVQFGTVDAVAGALAMEAVDRAVDLCLSGEVDAMVTAPISKESVRLSGHPAVGHTRHIARRSGAADYAMMMVSPALRVALLTDHIPLAQVAGCVTAAAIVEKLRVVDRSLRADFGRRDPVIAVLGLNPHAGDAGAIGSEDTDIVAPALHTARDSGIRVAGPFSGDSFFGSGAYRRYDAVLAMYHDQGLGPFKTLAFQEGVNFTAGIPIVRTSPDHGTAFDIAGRGQADATSMVRAIRVAMEVAARRRIADSVARAT